MAEARVFVDCVAGRYDAPCIKSDEYYIKMMTKFALKMVDFVFKMAALSRLSSLPIRNP